MADGGESVGEGASEALGEGGGGAGGGPNVIGSEIKNPEVRWVFLSAGAGPS